jgi:putative NADPH-quinone reductase
MNNLRRRVLIIDGHPDPAPGRFCHALAQAYADGAVESGREVRRINVANEDFGFIRSASQFGLPPDSEFILRSQADFRWAEHIVIVFPLWLGATPALLKAFIEQVARGGLIAEADRLGWSSRLGGRSGRIIVTTGMSAWAYRWIFLAQGVASMKRSIFHFAGIRPLRICYFGDMASALRDTQELRLAHVAALGRQGR